MSISLTVENNNNYTLGVSQDAITLSVADKDAWDWWLSGGISAANCIGAYKAAGATSLAASYVNLANPGTYNLTVPVAAPTFSTLHGWSFDGLTQYLLTGITPADARTWTMIVRFSGRTNTGFLAGYYKNTAFGFLAGPYRTTGHTYYNGNTKLETTIAAPVEGIMAVAGGNAYFDSASDGTITTGASSGIIAIAAAQKDDGTAQFLYGGNIQSVAIYNTVLTPAQIAAVGDAMIAIDPIEFSLVFLPDTQAVISDTLHTTFEDMADWIVTNKSTLKIAIVLDAGDLTDTNLPAEWTRLDAMYDDYDVVNLPYLATSGNHDGDGPVPVRGAMVDWQTVFPQSRYTSKSWWNGGFFEVGQSQNAYLILGDYLYLSLEHIPRQVVIDWAKTVAAAWPNKKIIMCTHAMEYSEGSRFSTTGDLFDADEYYGSDLHNGDDIWNELCKLYSNFILLMNGHFTTSNNSRHLATGDNGNKVESEYINYQGTTAGYVRVISFYNGGDSIWARTYRINVGWVAGANTDFTVDLT